MSNVMLMQGRRRLRRLLRQLLWHSTGFRAVPAC
jgi:hypothetical protein